MPKLLFSYVIYIAGITPIMYDKNLELSCRLISTPLIIIENTTAGIFEIKNLHIKLFH